MHMEVTKISGITGALLAGGKSKRMGVDKRLIEIGDRTLFARALDVLEGIFSEIVISVAHSPENLPVGRHPVVLDCRPGLATLGGLYSVLQVVSSEWVFAVACDMPFLNPDLIRYLVGLRGGYDYVMPMLSTGPQPMHACYRISCVPVLAARMEGGDLRLHGLLEDPALRGLCVPEKELLQFDPHLRSFLNINSPSDLEMVRKLLASSASRQ